MQKNVYEQLFLKRVGRYMRTWCGIKNDRSVEKTRMPNTDNDEPQPELEKLQKALIANIKAKNATRESLEEDRFTGDASVDLNIIRYRLVVKMRMNTLFIEGKFTQPNIAAALGVNLGVVNRWLNYGSHHMPSVVLMYQFAGLYNTHCSELFSPPVKRELKAASMIMPKDLTERMRKKIFMRVMQEDIEEGLI